MSTTIKDAIQQIIEGYKKDYRSRVGGELIVYPVGMYLETIELGKLKKLTEEYMKIEYEPKNRNSEYITFRKLFIRVATDKMGYRDEKIAKALGLDRTSVLYYRQNTKWTDVMTVRYAQFLDYLNNK